MRHGIALWIVVVGLAWAAQAQAETTAAESARPSNRATGFALEVDLSAVTPVVGDVLVIPAGVAIAPRLSLGAQLSRLFIGLEAGISFFGVRGDGADEYSEALWTVRIGPILDGEVWTSGRVSLFVGGALTALIFATEDDDYHANGFSIDAFFGGRVYVVEQLAIQLLVGSDFAAVFTEVDVPGDDIKATSLGWTLYGALGFRFVAG